MTKTYICCGQSEQAVEQKWKVRVTTLPSLQLQRNCEEGREEEGRKEGVLYSVAPAPTRPPTTSLLRSRIPMADGNLNLTSEPAVHSALTKIPRFTSG